MLTVERDECGCEDADEGRHRDVGSNSISVDTRDVVLDDLEDIIDEGSHQLVELLVFLFVYRVITWSSDIYCMEDKYKRYRE